MKLIINADDFGINENVNEAIVYCFENKLISNTTIMVNMPYTEQAVQQSKAHGFFDKVGLHLNLREGTPLTEVIQQQKVFCDNTGAFCMNISALQRYFMPFMCASASLKRSLSDEIYAQMQWYIDQGFSEMHMDSHQAVHTWLFFLTAILPLFKENSFRTMRKRAFGYNESTVQKIYRWFINIHIPNPTDTMMDIASFIKYYEKLDQGKLYEIMCHPIMKNGVPIDALSGIAIEEITEGRNIELVSYGKL